MKIRTCLATVAGMALAGSAFSQAIQPPTIGGGGGPGGLNDKLAVGSPAPELDIQEWIKGDKVEKLEEGRAYIVKFWATWCAPCRASIPHLTELASHYKTVTFIGVSDEEPGVIRPFVQRMGSKMEYTVAADNRERTKRKWMRAAGQTGIPCAFIVDQNTKIAYIGHPMDEKFAQVLSEVASGRYDPELMKAAEPFLAQVDHCVKVRDWRVCENYLDQVIALNPHIFNEVALQKFKIWLMDKDDAASAIAYARGIDQYAGAGILQTYESDAETLGLLVKRILSNKEWLNKSPDELKALCMDLADAAYRADTGAQTLSIMAMANYHNGNVEEAINLQRKAYLMADPNTKSEMQRLLDSYVEGAAARRG